MLRKPEIVCYGLLLQQDLGAGANLGKEPVEADRFEDLGLHSNPLILILVDPKAPAHTGQHFCLMIRGLIAALRLRIQNPAVVSIHGFFSRRPEIEGVHHVHQHGLVVTALLLIFRYPPGALAVGFMLSLAHLDVQLSRFFSSIARRKWMIVNRGQAIVWRAVDHEYFVRSYDRTRVMLGLDIALFEGITRRLAPIGFDGLDGSPDDVLGIGRLGGSGYPRVKAK